jgi:hypothetical protein
MKATIGDRVIVAATGSHAVRRDGRVVALHHADGSPPYDVLWSDTGRTTLFFPGPDTELHHFTHPDHDRTAVETDRRMLHTSAD